MASGEGANIFSRLPEQHTPHALHGPDRAFRETNCYVDVWIEVLHALGLEPLACLAFTLASDFEGDQWTFFKPPHSDLERLYGVRVEELSLWRPLAEQVVTQVGRGRLPLVEVDAYFLPDTAASDYRKNHVKTTVAISGIDVQAKRLHYFHNLSLHVLSGGDFDGVLRPEASERLDYLPPFCEIIKPERARALDVDRLRAESRELAKHHYAKRPENNPLEAHAAQLPDDLAMLTTGDLPTYHAYSFVSMRQLGAAYELAASYLRWLNGDVSGGSALLAAAASFEDVAATAKMLILKLARITNSRRGADLSATFTQMAAAWQRGMDQLSDELGA